MTDIKVGQVRFHKEHFDENSFVYAITAMYSNLHGDWWTSINRKGFTESNKKDELLKDELIATYPTWQEAVNSKEFKGVKYD